MPDTPQTRIVELCNIIAGDATSITLIKEVLIKALNYVNAVNILEHYVMLGGDDQDEIQRLDQRRTLAHNALIDSVKITNRYLFSHYGGDIIPVGGIYSDAPLHLSTGNRRAIGDWAGRLVSEVFQSRR
jgi:hypothetical protein